VVEIFMVLVLKLGNGKRSSLPQNHHPPLNTLYLSSFLGNQIIGKPISQNLVVKSLSHLFFNQFMSVSISKGY
jgi:hypothetical protein